MPTPEGPHAEIWAAPDQAFPAGLVADVLAQFEQLVRRRIEHVRLAGIPRWSLYRDEHGVAWAPGDPSTWTREREYQACELVRTTIGRRRVAAACRSCKAEIPEGVTAWRPAHRGWTSAGLALRWCNACVHAVQSVADEQPEPDECVRHLRVFAGGRV